MYKSLIKAKKVEVTAHTWEGPREDIKGQVLQPCAIKKKNGDFYFEMCTQLKIVDGLEIGDMILSHAEGATKARAYKVTGFGKNFDKRVIAHNSGYKIGDAEFMRVYVDRLDMVDL